MKTIFHQMKLLKAFFLLLPLVAFFSCSSLDIKYIDNNKVLSESELIKLKKKELIAELKIYQQNSDSILALFKTEIKAYEKVRNTLSDEAKKTKEELLQLKHQNVMRYQKAMQQEAAKKEAEVLDVAIQEINNQIQDYCKQKGYAMVLGANGQGSVVYADASKDITAEVIEAINSISDKKTN